MKEMQENQISTGARIGYFFLSLLPAVLCIILQVGALLVILLPVFVLRIFDGTIDNTSLDSMMAGYMGLVNSLTPVGVFLYHILGILVFGLWYRLSFNKPRPDIKESFQRMTGRSVLVSVVCGIAFCFFTNATVIIEAQIIPSVVDHYAEMAEAVGFGNNVLVLIATMALAPIGEELLCRGVILHFARKSLGRFWPANILQAILFSCIHANLVQGIYAFFIGLVLGWLVKRYRTIIPAMLMHFVINFSASTWASYVFSAVFGETMPSLVVGILLLAVSGGMILLMMYWDHDQQPKTIRTESDGDAS